MAYLFQEPEMNPHYAGFSYGCYDSVRRTVVRLLISPRYAERSWLSGEAIHTQSKQLVTALYLSIQENFDKRDKKKHR
jgi:hypothetical protein